MKKRKSLISNKPVTSASLTAQSHAQDIKWVGYIEVACGAILLLMIVIFHVLMMTHSEALWRDEIATYNLALMPSLGQIFKNLDYDSFPILWYLILRGWIYMGMGSDAGLRVLGMLVGIGGTFSLILACRMLGSRVALIALVLLGFSPTVYLVGDSLRAYGFGMMLMFLTLGFFWRAVNEPCLRKIFPAGLLAILSVQCVYYNSIILFAMGMGGVALGLCKRDLKKIAAALGIGAIAALTLIPYMNVIKRVNIWNVLLRIDFTIPLMMDKFRQAVESAGAHIYWIWVALLPIAITACVWMWFQTSKKNGTQERERVVFIFTTLIVAVIGYIVFLKVLSYQTEPWYYLLIMAIMAVMLDAVISLLVKANLTGRIICLVFVLIIIATTGMNTWNAVHTRKTNVDLLAAKLCALSTKNDLIVVNRHFFGITFARYYKGDTTWVTMPPLTDHNLHRYDLVMEKMMETDPLVPVHEKIQKTLQKGNRVWVVGWVYFLRNGELPVYLPSAPHSPYGWHEGPYSDAWWQQTAYLLQQHANNAELVHINSQKYINPYESLQLVVFRGWHP